MKTLFRFLLTVMLVAIIAVFGVSINAAAEDKIVLVLDPGHGGNDPGTTIGTRYESEYNYDIALLLKSKLEATGKFQIYLTRGRNEKPVYLLRAAVAEQYNADMLISLHFNSNPTLDPTLNGVEVLASVLDEWCPMTLAESICASISKDCGLANGGVVRKKDTGDERGVYYWEETVGWDVPGTAIGRVSDYYSMISWGTKLGFPSIIVEHAYLSNASDLAFCDSEGGLEKMAQAEANAIIKYFTGHTHTYGVETCDRVANCCLEGIYSRKCTVCGHRTDVRRTPVSPNVHVWTVETKDVTCTEDGYVNKECQISRNLSEKGFEHIVIHTENRTQPATGHTFVTEVDTPAGHAVDGLLRQVCTKCSEVSETVRRGDPHIYVNVESSAVSCTEGGFDKYECSVCHDVYTDEYAPLGHSYVSDGMVLTCASDKNREYVCTVCGNVMSENVEIPPHNFVESENVLPGCTSEGKKTVKCTVCGTEESETVPPLGHKFPEEGEVRLAPTHFAEGELVFVCANDPSHINIEKIPAKSDRVFITAAIVAGVVVLVAVVLLIVHGRHRDVDENELDVLTPFDTVPEEDAAVSEADDRKMGIIADEADDVLVDFSLTENSPDGDGSTDDN